MRAPTRPLSIVGDHVEVSKILDAVIMARTITPWCMGATDYHTYTTPMMCDRYRDRGILVVGHTRPSKYLTRVTVSRSNYTQQQIYFDLLSRNQKMQFDFSKMTPEEYKLHRADILNDRHRAEVKARVDQLQREERQRQIAEQPDEHKLAEYRERRAELKAEGRKTDIYDQEIATLEATIAADKKREAFLKSDNYTTTLPLAMADRELVAQYDPESLTDVDAAIKFFEDAHQNPERLFGDLARISQPAFLAEMKQRRQAQQDQAKMEMEAAQKAVATAEQSTAVDQLRTQLGGQQ